MSNEANNPASCQTAVSGSAFSIHDLKCGNILNYDTSEGEILPTVIDWQDLKWLTEDPKGFNLVHSPIFLNSEWLEKLGFDKIENSKHKVRVGLDGDDFVKHQMTYMLNRQFVTKIKYVHELQNLHYSLTGEMLSLSLTANTKLDNMAMLILYSIQRDIENTLEKLYPGDSELIDETYLDKRVGVQMSVECIENDDNIPEIWVTEDVEVFDADTGETLTSSSEKLHKDISEWIENYNAYKAKDYSLAKFDCVTPNY